jgi:L-lactate dehydrogenase complex protein LldG
MSDARSRILERVRGALATREPVDHPGHFAGWRPNAPSPDPANGFAALFTRSGGEVETVPTVEEARRWIQDFSAAFDGIAVGSSLPAGLAPDGPIVSPENAALGVSMARAAVAESGSLVLDARDGRLTQLLPPTHLVVLRRTNVFSTLVEALETLSEDLPSALGLHSGPSKSADIGQILVKGVHGPGRAVALLVDDAETPDLDGIVGASVEPR